MIIFFLACVVSFVPCTALYLWLGNHVRTDAQEKEVFKITCKRALVQGIFAVIPIVLLSALSYVALRLTRLQDTNALLYEALYTFIVLALMEEIMKYRAFRRVIKKTDHPCSWLDVTVLMTIAAIGFGMIESVIYAIGASVPVVLVRGICVPHAGYGFIVGYFYGKGLKNESPAIKWVGFAIAWFLHGLYDFSLSEEFVAINDNLMFIALLLAILDIVLVIALIVFVRKRRTQKAYTQPLLDNHGVRFPG